MRQSLGHRVGTVSSRAGYDIDTLAFAQCMQSDDMSSIDRCNFKYMTLYTSDSVQDEINRGPGFKFLMYMYKLKCIDMYVPVGTLKLF